MARQHVSAGPRREPPDEEAPVPAAAAPSPGEEAGVGDPSPPPGRPAELPTHDPAHDGEHDSPDLVAAGDQAAFVAVERQEQGAILAFVRRFHPVVLGVARRLGIPPARRDEFAADVLGDVAQRLALGDARHEPSRRPSPLRATAVSSPRAYLAGCAQKRYAEELRQRTVRERHEEALAREGRPHYEGAVAATCSESALRESEGPLWECSPPTPAIQRLAAALRAVLAEEQERLFDMLTYGASYHEIGAALDTSVGTRHDERHDERRDNDAERAASAAKQRVYRLRKRLSGVAFAYAADPAACSDEDYPHVRRLLRRSGLLDDGGFARLQLVRCGAAPNPLVPTERGPRSRARPKAAAPPKLPENQEKERDDA